MIFVMIKKVHDLKNAMIKKNVMIKKMSALKNFMIKINFVTTVGRVTPGAVRDGRVDDPCRPDLVEPARV